MFNLQKEKNKMTTCIFSGVQGKVIKFYITAGAIYNTLPQLFKQQTFLCSCCSYVGRRGGKQYLSLGTGCLRFGIITHELGHAVGFWHEQNRPDRSIYIDVIYDNVDSSKYLNFDPREMNEVDTFDQVRSYKLFLFTKHGFIEI